MRERGDYIESPLPHGNECEYGIGNESAFGIGSLNRDSWDFLIVVRNTYMVGAILCNRPSLYLNLNLNSMWYIQSVSNPNSRTGATRE